MTNKERFLELCSKVKREGIDINAVSSFIDTVATASKKINRMKVVDADTQNK